MHEQSLVDSLINKIVALAKRENAEKVTKVHVKLGIFSHMDAKHFKEHFDISAKGTIAEGALIQAELSEDETDPNAHFVTLISFDILNEQ